MRALAVAEPVIVFELLFQVAQTVEHLHEASGTFVVRVLLFGQVLFVQQPQTVASRQHDHLVEAGVHVEAGAGETRCDATVLRSALVSAHLSKGEKSLRPSSSSESSSRAKMPFMVTYK